jgi:hypothetical protein
MILFALYLLALVDGVLCGFRTAAGRRALIHSGRANLLSMLRGFAVAQAASVLALGALVVTMEASHNSGLLLPDLKKAAAKMVTVFTIYAALVLFNLALRLVPSVDIRSATSVLALGPLTALRPFVMVAGTLYGIWDALPTTRLLGIFVLALMLGSEWLLNTMNDRLQQQELEALVPSE